MAVNRKQRRAKRSRRAVYRLKQSKPSATPIRRKWIWYRLLTRVPSLLIISCIAAIAGTLWLSYEYLLNPDVAFFLDSGSAAPRSSRPQTLKQIQAALDTGNQSMGQPLVLKTELGLLAGLNSPAQVVVPVYRPARCAQPCNSIQELRLYRSLRLPFLIRLFQRYPFYRTAQLLPIQGPSELDVTALEGNPLLSLGSKQSLPLAQLIPYDAAPGTWLRLTGVRNAGTGVATYGQLYYFDRDRERLTLMLNWVSPKGDFPRWKQVVADETPELFLDQSVGLEPRYSIYQLQIQNGAASNLIPVTLDKPAFANSAYEQALAAARNGLWTPAQQQLRQVKTTVGDRWSTEAQTQLDLIQLHAKVTQSQVEQSFASSSQRILAYLINGSWRAARDVFESDRAVRNELQEMLLSDTGRIASRLQAGLQLTPNDPDLIAWAAMQRLVRSNAKQATAWATKQAAGNGATLALVNRLLRELQNLPEQESADPAESASPLEEKPTEAEQPLADAL